MSKGNIPVSGGGKKAGWAFERTRLTMLDDCPSSLAGHAGELLIVKATEDGFELKTEAVVDEYKVKANSADAAPDFLDGKIDDSTIKINGSDELYLPTDSHALAGAEHSTDTITNLNTKLTDGSLITSKPGEIDALSAKGTPTTSDLLLIEDAADSNNKKKITIADLPAATPAMHDIGGAQHASSIIADVNALLSDGDMITTLSGEINSLVDKSSPVGADEILIEDSESSYAKKKATIENILSIGPALHDIGGAKHASSIIADVNALLSDGDMITTLSAEISALTHKASPVAADFLMIEDSEAGNAKKYVLISELPAATPASHAFAGAQHSTDTITNVNTKLTDGSLITTKAGEIDALTNKSSPTSNDIIMIEDVASGNAKKKIALSALPARYITEMIAKTFYNPSGITATVNLLVMRFQHSATIASVHARRSGGGASATTINARKNGASNHLSSDLSLAAADTWYSNSSISNASYSADDWLEFMITGVAGSPTQILIEVVYTRTV